MIQISGYTRFGTVEGLGDEEIPWWIAPYVRDFAALARSTALLEAAQRVRSDPMPGRALSARIVEAAAIARVAARMGEGGKQLLAGVTSVLRAEIDDYCGTPPRPHLVVQAALAVSLIASSLRENDAAKPLLVAEAEKLQKGL